MNIVFTVIFMKQSDWGLRLNMHLGRMLLMLWENCSQYINCHLDNLLENLARDDPQLLSLWSHWFWSGLHQSVKYQLFKLGSLEPVLLCSSAKDMLYLTCITTLWLFLTPNPLLCLFWSVWSASLQTVMCCMLCHQTSTLLVHFTMYWKKYIEEHNSY